MERWRVVCEDCLGTAYEVLTKCLRSAYEVSTSSLGILRGRGVCKFNYATFQRDCFFISDPVIRDSATKPLNIRIRENKIVKHSGRWLSCNNHMHTTTLPTFHESFFYPGSDVSPRWIDKRFFAPIHLKTIKPLWSWVRAWVHPSFVLFQNTWRGQEDLLFIFWIPWVFHLYR